jgi:antitoxin ParD1/3/4
MSMATMNISLPDSMRDFIENQVRRGGVGTASEYIRALVREAQKRDAEEQIEAKLLEALADPSREVTEERWQALRARARQQVAKRKRRT